jgi:hypothetical protein
MADSMTEDEVNELMDRWFLKKFGVTFREDDSAKLAIPVDTLERIKTDFPELFG